MPNGHSKLIIDGIAEFEVCGAVCVRVCVWVPVLNCCVPVLEALLYPVRKIQTRLRAIYIIHIPHLSVILYTALLSW